MVSLRVDLNVGDPSILGDASNSSTMLLAPLQEVCALVHIRREWERSLKQRLVPFNAVNRVEYFLRRRNCMVQHHAYLAHLLWTKGWRRGGTVSIVSDVHPDRDQCVQEIAQTAYIDVSVVRRRR
jgi:hypothetical protein